MYLFSPVAYPIARLLDNLLGKGHMMHFKRAGLKSLVRLHKSFSQSSSDGLSQDEVTIISSVLDMKGKSVSSIMTPLSDVFTLSSDTLLDKITKNWILESGHSRIPIHVPGDATKFEGMLLVKRLITHDFEEEVTVGQLQLANLPTTPADTSCLDILNFFQTGKSHMVVVTERWGTVVQAIGVLTLEDVMEELIGE
jgi:metal transporter CNNM